jgi:Nucleotide modification associated domain 2
MSPKIFRYVVRYDHGSAPRPFGGWCSLTICKPRIRASAQPGDWIIGFRSRSPGRVTYVMQVEEVIPLGIYWADPRFVDRRPGFSPVPDNIYRSADNGTLQQVANPVHGPADEATDVSGKNALVGRRFWYFGSDSPDISTDLVHLVHAHIGEAFGAHRRPDDVQHLERWLASWPQGVLGLPLGASSELLAQIAGSPRIAGLVRSSMAPGTCESRSRRTALNPNSCQQPRQVKVGKRC